MSIAESISLAVEYQRIRKETIDRVRPLETEDFVAQPVLDVSPPKWHLAHSTWFFEEFILSQYLPEYQRFHPKYSFLFNSYYEGIGKRTLRPERGHLTRPTVREIMDYREYVDRHMEAYLQDPSPDAIKLVNVGLNHEQQHQELLMTDIKYILGHNPLYPAYDPNFNETPSIVHLEGFTSVGEGIYEVGYQGNGFHFDNESPRHKVFLNDFHISNEMVTNRDYLDFMRSGGYEDPLLWHSDAWTYIKENDIRSPMYWIHAEGTWKRYSLSGLHPLDPDEPVTHISFFEAAAFAQWAGMRLPTEFEWEVASPHLSDIGLRWEHTESAYLPYPGYQRPEGAIGEYNGKFMVNQMVLRGSSVVTPQGHTRPSYRNFFHPHLRWQFSGIRLCKRQGS